MSGPAKLAAAAALALQALAPQAQPVPEHELKAAFVYNFVLFTEWPAGALPDSAGAVQLCTAGRGPVVAALESLDGKQVKTRRLTVRGVSTAESVKTCHLLYVAPAGASLAALAEGVRAAPVLTVSDTERAGAVAVIALATEGAKVVFDIDNESARRVQLALSSRLLKLARSVR